MANIASAKKAIRSQEKKRQRNIIVRSMLKTVQKDALGKLSARDAGAESLVLQTISELDKAVAKGIIHKNKASRRKSRLTKRLNASKVAA